MRVLVTGGEGQVGSEVARLADADFDVRPFRHNGLDIADPLDVGRHLDVVAPDVLVNCAAYTAVDQAEDEPDRAYAVNAAAVGLLGRACAARGISIIYRPTMFSTVVRPSRTLRRTLPTR